MSKPVILTGLRANNDLHIGNYLGALLPIVDMAKQRAGEYQINLFVPDLHSFTTPIDHGKLYEQSLQNLRVYTAAGLPLDNPDIHIYRQSYIPAHSELTWILDCFTGFGEMSRMTQFKDKSQKLSQDVNEKVDRLTRALTEIEKEVRKEDLKKSPFSQLLRLANLLDEASKPELAGELRDIRDGFINNYNEAASAYLDVSKKLEEATFAAHASVGLFNYPVLMAADILLYDASYVPVGDDQTQHLEFTRDIAERMNNQFEELFTVPLPVPKQHEFFGKDQGLRIRDLQDPTKKMSKSDETGKGVIFLGDTPDQARKKIMSAATDSLGEVQYDYKERPGVSNLLDMLKLFGGESREFIGQTQYGPLKNAVADKVAAFLEDFQAKLASVDQAAIDAKLAASEAAMNSQANTTLLKVQKAVGLRP